MADSRMKGDCSKHGRVEVIKLFDGDLSCAVCYKEWMDEHD